MNGHREQLKLEFVRNANQPIGIENRENKIPYGYCHCGCGKKTNIEKMNRPSRGRKKGDYTKFISGHNSRFQLEGKESPKWKGGFYKSGNRYLKYSPKHPRANKDGMVYNAILVAEKILGRYLNKSNVVHHIDGNSSNDENKNLVICENQGYHLFIEKKTRALKACGNSNWRICTICHQYDDKINLFSPKSSSSFYHRKCKSDYDRKYKKRDTIE